MKNYYKIGEICKMFGLGADSLRYYEEISLLSPKRDTNGYRMYGIKEIQTLNVVKELRSLGFTIKDINLYLSNYDIDKKLDLFQREMIMIDKKILELTSLREKLNERSKELNYFKALSVDSSDFSIDYRHERKILQINENVYLEDHADILITKLQGKYEALIPILRNGKIGAISPLSKIKRSIYGHYTSAFYILDNDSNIYDSVLPEGYYLTTYFRGSYTHSLPLFLQMIDYAYKKGFAICGDPLEIFILDNHDTMKSEEFITCLELPVQRDNH